MTTRAPAVLKTLGWIYKSYNRLVKYCLYAHNQQKHRANLFLKNHLAGFIQSSRILIKKFKKGLALPKGNCLAVTNELEENPMSCSRSQSFCVTKIFVLSVMKPQTKGLSKCADVALS